MRQDPRIGFLLRTNSDSLERYDTQRRCRSKYAIYMAYAGNISDQSWTWNFIHVQSASGRVIPRSDQVVRHASMCHKAFFILVIRSNMLFRLRRVKCDEAKPACDRCVKSQRTVCLLQTCIVHNLGAFSTRIAGA